ncbi:MAG: MarR family transcriptional regulator [Burkholderiales bacterium]
MTASALPLPDDHERRAADDHHASLRLWLRMLTCTLMIERTVRARLRERFAISLPRFDLMAQLERAPDGLTMGELSRRLMVTGGNVTGLTRELVEEGLVRRSVAADDRRSFSVRLTAKGKRVFDAMAVEHERWIVDTMAGVPAADRARLYALLGTLKLSLRTQASEADAATPATGRRR